MISVDSLTDFELLLVHNLIMVPHFYEWVKLKDTFTSESYPKCSFPYLLHTFSRTGQNYFICKEGYPVSSIPYAAMSTDRDSQGHPIRASRATQKQLEVLNGGVPARFMAIPIAYKKLTIRDLPRYKNKLLDLTELVYNSNPEEFEKLFAENNIAKSADLRLRIREKALRRSFVKRSVEFSLKEQKYIAQLFYNALIKNNYLMNLAVGKLNKDHLDRTGKKLFDALALFNVDVEKLLQEVVSHKGNVSWDKEKAGAARRFAIAYSQEDLSVLGLIDDDPLVRESVDSRKKDEGAV